MHGQTHITGLSMEAAIRYLLSGAVIATILVMSLNDSQTIFQWALSNQVPTALCVALIGFTAFSIYRLVLWVVFDFIAWKFNASAPAEFFLWKVLAMPSHMLSFFAGGTQKTCLSRLAAI